MHVGDMAFNNTQYSLNPTSLNRGPNPQAHIDDTAPDGSFLLRIWATQDMGLIACTGVALTERKRHKTAWSTGPGGARKTRRQINWILSWGSDILTHNGRSTTCLCLGGPALRQALFRERGPVRGDIRRFREAPAISKPNPQNYSGHDLIELGLVDIL